MNGKIYKLGDFLVRKKDVIILDELTEYKRVTIKMHKKGVILRDITLGKNILTKKQFIISGGEFILSKIDARNGAFGIVPTFLEGAVISGDFLAYIVDENIILKELFFTYVELGIFDEICRKSSIGATNRKRVNESIFLNSEIFIPNIDQKKLIQEINITKERGTELININIKNLSYIKQLKQAILQEAIEGKLTSSWRENNPNIESASILLEKIQKEKEELVKQKKLKKQEKLKEISEDEIPFEIPENWSWCRLGNILNKLTDGTHHSPENGNYGDYKYISAKNIKNDGIMLSNITYVKRENHESIYSRCNPEKGDILYIKDGATTGITTINTLDEEFSMLSSVALMKVSEKIYNRYILYVLKSGFYFDIMRADMSGVAITRVTLTQLAHSIIPLPPLSEQKEIVKRVDELMRLCDELEKQCLETKESSENLMKSVLQGVFSR